jgi:hypothetical protein
VAPSRTSSTGGAAAKEIKQAAMVGPLDVTIAGSRASSAPTQMMTTAAIACSAFVVGAGGVAPGIACRGSPIGVSFPERLVLKDAPCLVAGDLSGDALKDSNRVHAFGFAQVVYELLA